MAENNRRKIQLDKIDNTFDDSMNKLFKKVFLKNKITTTIQKRYSKYGQVLSKKTEPVSTFVRKNIEHVLIGFTAFLIYIWYVSATDLEKVDFAFEILHFSIVAYFIFWFIPKLYSSVWFRRLLFLFLFIYFLNSCGIEKQPHTRSLSNMDKSRIENINKGHSSLNATMEEKKIPPLLNAKPKNEKI